MFKFKRVVVFDASLGCTDTEMTVEVLPVLQFIPRVGETLTTKKGCYHIGEVSYDIEKHEIVLWIDDERSDIYG